MLPADRQRNHLLQHAASLAGTRAKAGSRRFGGKTLKGTSPVAWRNVNLIGNFDFTISSTQVDIEALAARYQNEDFWRRSMTEVDDDGPE
jgi:hypothetical protein